MSEENKNQIHISEISGDVVVSEYQSGGITAHTVNIHSNINTKPEITFSYDEIDGEFITNAIVKFSKPTDGKFVVCVNFLKNLVVKPSEAGVFIDYPEEKLINSICVAHRISGSSVYLIKITTQKVENLDWGFDHKKGIVAFYGIGRENDILYPDNWDK